MRKLIDLTGKKFGKLTVICRGPNQTSQTRWQCLCECGKETTVQSNHLRNEHTQSCGCSWYEFGKTRISWKGHGEIPLSLFGRIRRNARNRNIPFDISIQYIWNLFLKQDKKCALSGLQLDFTYGRNHHHKGTASLDRIDSTKGYVKDNVQWVHKDVNWMKQDYSNDYFLNMCETIVNYNKNNNASI